MKLTNMLSAAALAALFLLTGSAQASAWVEIKGINEIDGDTKRLLTVHGPNGGTFQYGGVNKANGTKKRGIRIKR